MLSGCALIGFSQLGSDDGPGELETGIVAADALATDGIKALSAEVPQARLAGPSSTVSQCGGDFPIASYSINGSVLGLGAKYSEVESAWEAAGLEVERGEDGELLVSRDGAVMTFLAAPIPGAGRFEVRIDCTNTPRDEIDELEESAQRDFGEELGLPQDPAFD